jgi:hypothetical protein
MKEYRVRVSMIHEGKFVRRGSVIEIDDRDARALLAGKKIEDVKIAGGKNKKPSGPKELK